MKKNEQSLVDLISSLTVTEKQLFKRRHRSDNDFVLLFDYINKNKSCETVSIRTYLEKKGSKRRNYSPGYLSSIKSYLKERVLESLRIIQSNKKSPQELLARCINIDILVDKGLYHLAREEMDEIEERFFDQSFPSEKLVLLRRSSLLQFYENYQNSTLEDINQMYDERIRLTEQTLLEAKYARIVTILSYQYFKGITDKETLKRFMLEDYMQDESLASEFETRYLFHWVHAQFNELQNRPEEAIKHFEKAVREWTSNPQYIEANPKMYLGACFTYLKYMVQQSDPYTQILNLTDFENILNLLSTSKLKKAGSDQYAQLFQVGKLLALRKKNEFGEIIKIAPLLEKTFTSSQKPSHFIRILANYNLASSFFYLENFKKVDDLISDVTHSKDVALHDNPEYFSLILILSLMNQYEMGNLKYLRSLRINYKNQLSSFGRFNEVEEVFFKLFSQLTAERYQDDRAAVFERFIPRAKSALTKTKLSSHLDFKFFINWMESKVA